MASRGKRDFFLLGNLVADAYRVADRPCCANFKNLLCDALNFCGGDAISVLLCDYSVDNFPIIKKSFCYGFEKKWLSLYVEREFFRFDPVLKVAGKHKGVFSWEWALGASQVIPPAAFVEALNKYGLLSGFSFSISDPVDVSRCSVVVFSVKADCKEKWKDGAQLLSVLAPTLRDAFISVWERDKVFLSDREIEILGWVKEGKTAWEIAMIIGVVEATVKFHLKKIYKKLNVVNKAQAIAKAIDLGAIR